MPKPIDIWHAFSITLYLVLPAALATAEYRHWLPAATLVSAFGIVHVCKIRGIIP